MLIIGHLAFGYLVSLVLVEILNIPLDYPYINYLFLIGLIAAVIPDLDTWLFFYKYKSLKFQGNDSHRKYISHAPILWIILSISIYFISANDFFKYASLFILFGSMSHFIGDSLEYGIMWLWPFSKKQYYLHKIRKENFQKKESLFNYYRKFFLQIYVKNWTFYVEVILIIVSLLFYFKVL